MTRINILVSLYSLTAFVVIIERLSPTTQILLQPYNFIRLHELIQTNVLLLITVILSFFVVAVVTNNFQTLKSRYNQLFFAVFIAGVYLYGAGEGWHEVASFMFNHYCNTHNPIGNLCHGLFINDYYTGNIIFFIGGVMMNVSVIALAAGQSVKKVTNKDMIILLTNAVVYAFTWFAYAAFDTVLVGLFFSALLMVISIYYSYKTQFQWKSYPYITYSTFAYTLSTIASLLVRLSR